MATTNHVAANAAELTSVAEVADRYRRRGPHATVVLRRSIPGQLGDDPSTRWHARRNELRHAGADDEALDQLDSLVESLDPRGEMVLLSTDGVDAVFCWLIDQDVPPSVHVGPTPALLPALVELTDRAPLIAAVIDRIGADLYSFAHLDLVDLGAVTGERVQTHRHDLGDQAGFERRNNELWERNAELVAGEVSDRVARTHASVVVLTGDDRQVAAVDRHLDHHHLTIQRVAAGSRHEPTTPERVLQAAIEQSLAARVARRNDSVARLLHEVGTAGLATVGAPDTATALGEGRVDTLFLTNAATVPDAAVDALVDQCLGFGGRIIVCDEVPARDGVAGLLRYSAG